LEAPKAVNISAAATTEIALILVKPSSTP
jgi:hypothetical protein